MIKNNSFLALLTIFTFSFCCGSEMTFETVQQGKDLKKISQITLEEFFQIWIRNQRKVKIQTNVRILFEDSEYSYFGKTNMFGYIPKSRFFKVEANLLKKKFPNYESFFAEDLERYYWDHIVSKEDRDLWIHTENKTRQACGPEYSYSLSDQKVTLQVYWKVDSSCPTLSIFQEKVDRIHYDLNNGKISQ
ncbi:hypothetical protein [Leptospira alstonii]|uniref:Lipoprotein n=2 Tax=Leptospira alstonii TaxID=28452 RepID=M6CNY2_9LEPT|nr:hypothetical protein [Leptospira alstonii]EMJ93667.1 hypothetical protein LEP1GSC194_1685 [Leptospira alstonii serovar Sichuan str. 79601]EQA81414.1 hypothetical protein LEP1GSC193_2009 [Leptospira alstonii serovar Pingchang str. 80-412]